ncbi:Uncharacterised protein [uncultured Blautia sp.]|nr:Uncharacterised protein [uncultured Blautia sp.]
MVRPGQRRHHPAVRPVPAGAGQADHAAGAGTPPPLPSEQTGYEPGGGPGDGLHLQLRLDALRGPHPQQRPADGLLRRVLRCGISADRRVHPGLRTALPGSGTLHRHGAGFLQVPPECGALHGEDRRGAADRHGHPDRARREQRRRGGPLRRFSGGAQRGGQPGDPRGPRSGLHPDGPVRPVPHPLGLPGEDGVSELLGYLVRPLQDGDAGHPGPV